MPFPWTHRWFPHPSPSIAPARGLSRSIRGGQERSFRWIAGAVIAPLLAILLASAVGPGTARADSRETVRVELRPLGFADAPLPARLQAWAADSSAVPGYPDSVLCSHDGGPWGMGGWFYPDGASAVLHLVPGTYKFQASHGFEWLPVVCTVPVIRDTVINLRLSRLVDLRAEGWFAGDTHTHGYEAPVEMPVAPSDLMRVASAEDLAMFWAQDEGWNYTGGPSELSTPETILYFGVEWRNQTYGHGLFLNLHTWIDCWCCEPPLAAWPTLSVTRETWNPDTTQAMVLAHPESGAGFFDEGGWPAYGLGRELPVLATSGNLDGLDIGSYGNVGDVAIGSWTQLQNCGFNIPVSAGTDSHVSRYLGRPPGGYRVYAHERGGPHTPSRWVSALRAGRTFVTNGPLIPEFTVDGAEAGAVLDRSGPSTIVHVHVRTTSLLAPGNATLLVNGVALRSWPITWSAIQPTWTLEHDVTLTEGSWLAVRIDGETKQSWTASRALFAMTGAVQVRLDGLPPRRTASAGLMADWVDSLQILVEERGHWPSQTVHDNVLARLQASRSYFNSLFLEQPQAFDLLAPAEGETLSAGAPIVFRWSPAIDSEAGDRVNYRLQIATDESAPPLWSGSSGTDHELSVPAAVFRPGADYFWRVVATDRGGNERSSTPAPRRLHIGFATSAVPGDPILPGGPPRIVPRPNPAHGPLMIELVGGRLPEGHLEVYAPGGARVARIRVTPATTSLAWNGENERGRHLPSGAYWIRFVPGPGAVDPGVRPARAVLLR
jgi:hypothetical protein